MAAKVPEAARSKPKRWKRSDPRDSCPRRSQPTPLIRRVSVGDPASVTPASVPLGSDRNHAYAAEIARLARHRPNPTTASSNATAAPAYVEGSGTGLMLIRGTTSLSTLSIE